MKNYDIYLHSFFIMLIFYTIFGALKVVDSFKLQKKVSLKTVILNLFCINRKSIGFLHSYEKTRNYSTGTRF